MDIYITFTGANGGNIDIGHDSYNYSNSNDINITYHIEANDDAIPYSSTPTYQVTNSTLPSYIHLTRDGNNTITITGDGNITNRDFDFSLTIRDNFEHKHTLHEYIHIH